MTVDRSIPGLEVWKIPSGSLRVEVIPAEPHPHNEEVERRWAQLRRENPRYHDGAIWYVQHVDSGSPCLRVSLDGYKRLAVQSDTLDLGVRLLGVKGLIIGRDRAGLEHLLIARRGTHTRIYNSLWELAPGGGLDAHNPSDPIDESSIHAALVEEGREELGLTLDASAMTTAALVRDEIARSIDVMVKIAWPATVDPKRGHCHVGGNDWEYVDSAWLSRTDAPQFERASREAIAPPMRAVLHWLGWLTS